MAKECVLYDRICNGCGECDYCDLNPVKLCDNCGKCIDSGKEYEEIKIDGIITPGTSNAKYTHNHPHDHKHNYTHDSHGCDCGCDHNH
ncbi:MAG: hypothetical protein MRZ66_04135 [Clostridiales bacterium]|nr:hypothetical protein [Clostridiales bacterium]